MTGAKYTLEQQGAVANNLANVDTAGFKEALHRLRAVPVQTQALPSRAFTVDATVATNFEAGRSSTPAGARRGDRGAGVVCRADARRGRSLHPRRQFPAERERHPAAAQRPAGARRG